MALPYEGDTDFGRNAAYDLTQHEEVKPLAVNPRSSSASQNGTDYEFDNQKPKGCWERTQKSCNSFFLMICPGCITQIPSVVLILLAIIVVLFIILSIPLVFALTYSQPAAQLGEQPDQVLNGRDSPNYWPFGDDDDFAAVSMGNGTIPSIEDMLPPNVKICNGMGFVCASNPGITVGTYARCDGVANCPDGSDEANCAECETSFSCLAKGVKMCFRADVLCDGTAQCDDHSDEKMCQSSTCSSDEFKCSDMCLPKSFVCDGESHCGDSSDEKSCDGKCKNGSKWCKATSSCIPKWKLCDGIRNCPDGSDENECNCKTCSGKGKMLCKNDGLKDDEGFCVQLDRICDGAPDCPNGMDEDGCPSKNSTLFSVLRHSMKYL